MSSAAVLRCRLLDSNGASGSTAPVRSKNGTSAHTTSATAAG